MAGLLSRYFGFRERSTDLATEVRAGVTTFMVMAYIIFVNPVILGFTGVHIGGTDFDKQLALATSRRKNDGAVRCGRITRCREKCNIERFFCCSIPIDFERRL